MKNRIGRNVIIKRCRITPELKARLRQFARDHGITLRHAATLALLNMMGTGRKREAYIARFERNRKKYLAEDRAAGPKTEWVEFRLRTTAVAS